MKRRTTDRYRSMDGTLWRYTRRGWRKVKPPMLREQLFMNALDCRRYFWQRRRNYMWAGLGP